jgi:propanol-preferring alcohol dehydrogenase
MLLDGPHTALRAAELPIPEPGPGQVLVRVRACGVCHTDLHILDGELAEPRLPLIPGHQIVGTVVSCGSGSSRYADGTRIGIPWLGATDGNCPACLRGQENLCDHPTFTGYQVDGGFAEYAVADERFCFPIPDGFSDVEAAPLLCAGLIGYRTYRMVGEAVHTLGIYGFGAAAHIVAQLARHEGRHVFAFTRPGDRAAQAFALQKGAVWAGDSDQPAPETLDAALIFAPVGSLVVKALQDVRKGGTVVCGGIHMSDIPSFPYALLWEERVLRSVANLTRRDGEEFLALAGRVPIHTDVSVYPLARANEALQDLRQGRLTGAAVLSVTEE